MMHKCKLTILKTMLNEDLAAEYGIEGLRLFVGIILVSLLMLTLLACGRDTTSEIYDTTDAEVEIELETQEATDVAKTNSSEDRMSEVSNEAAAEELILSIDGETVEVVWENNDSVSSLTELAKNNPLEIQMSMYGGFEQVGALGADLPRSDEQTTTETGDIVLYQGNQIVVFYGSNSWAYTRLGYIAGKTSEDLYQLFGQQDITLTLEVK